MSDEEEDAGAEWDPVEAERFNRMRDRLDVKRLPHVRPKELRGVGGVLKQEPVYFDVDEVGLPEHKEAEPNGTHCYVRIRRSGEETRVVKDRLCKMLNLNDNDVAYAGLKDKYACTCQTFSICTKRSGTNYTPEEILAAIQADEGTPKLFVEGAPVMRRSKLRLGLLAGNRFQIVVTQLAVPLEEAYARACAIRDALADTGVPNYFGVQRVGKGAKTAMAAYRTVRVAERFLEEREGLAAANRPPQEAQKAQKAQEAQEAVKPRDDAAQAPGEQPQKVEAPAASANTEAPAEAAKAEAPAAPPAVPETAKGGEKRGQKRRKPPKRKEFIGWVKKRKLGVKGYMSWTEQFKMQAFQSGVFNFLVGKRVLGQTFAHDLVGDLIMRPETGARTKQARDAAALPSKEERMAGCTFTCPQMGPRYWYKRDTEGGRLEAEALDELGVNPDVYQLLDLELSRRAARLALRPMDMQIDMLPSTVAHVRDGPRADVVAPPSEDEAGLLFQFTLPKGSYATSVLREFMDDP